jgi:transglutaminase-like putative cysteine protease
VVKNKGNDQISNIRLEIPLLAELESPYQDTVKETFSHEPVEVKRQNNSNRVAVFLLDSLLPGASDTITLEYSLNVYPLNQKQLLASTYSASLFPQNYLGASEKIESNHPDIVRKARELTSACKTDLEKARAICSFVITYLKYDPNSSSRNGGALTALRNGSGVCEDYASLFAALCRASGIPARVVNGYCDFKGTGDIWNLSPGERFPLRGYRHSWVEFFLDGSGWVPADPTMDIHSGNMKYFGSLPQPSHLAQNYGDLLLKVRYKGSQLSVTWEEELIGR